MVLSVLSRRESAFQDDDVSFNGFGFHCVFHVPFRRDRPGKDQTLVRCATQCLATGPRKYGFEGLSDPTPRAASPSASVRGRREVNRRRPQVQSGHMRITGSQSQHTQ
jgi:hypothetical protein